jgi:hypothetical protein
MLMAAKDGAKSPVAGVAAAADISALICSRSAPKTASIVAGAAEAAGAATEFTAVTVATSTTLEVRESCRW